MPSNWTIVSISAAIAFTTCWHRRHTWRSRNHSIDTRSLLAHATGLLLLGPLGEPLGHLTEPWIYNLEDTSGHICIVWAAAASVINAGRILHAPQLARIAVAAAPAVAVAIVSAAYWSGAYSHPSTPSNPHDCAYWFIVPLILLPAYALASWANTQVFSVVDGRVRKIAGIQGASFAVGAAGCMCRLQPALPNSWMYWCYAACIVGTAVAQWAVWQPFRRHMRDISSLDVVGESRGIRPETFG